MKAGTFKTVEAFWKNYVHLKRPSNINTNVNVYLFRDGQGHVPMWEASSKGSGLSLMTEYSTARREAACCLGVAAPIPLSPCTCKSANAAR